MASMEKAQGAAARSGSKAVTAASLNCSVRLGSKVASDARQAITHNWFQARLTNIIVIHKQEDFRWRCLWLPTMVLTIMKMNYRILPTSKLIKRNGRDFLLLTHSTSYKWCSRMYKDLIR